MKAILCDCLFTIVSAPVSLAESIDQNNFDETLQIVSMPKLFAESTPSSQNACAKAILCDCLFTSVSAPIEKEPIFII